MTFSKAGSLGTFNTWTHFPTPMQRVAELVNRKPVVVDKNASLSDVLEAFDRHGISHVVIKRGDDIWGVFSEKDVLFKLGSARTWNVDLEHLRASSFANQPIIGVSEDADLAKAVKEMLDNEIGLLQVGAGILTKQDVVATIGDRYRDLPVSEVMSRNVISVGLDERFLHARDIVMKYRYSLLPVMDSGRVVGVVTDMMLLKHLAAIYEKVEWRFREHKARLTLVSDVYRRSFASLHPDESIAQAARLLASGEKAVLVMDGDTLSGIVTKTDILTLYLADLVSKA